MEREQMPELNWKREVFVNAGIGIYSIELKGIDNDNRNYHYMGRILCSDDPNKKSPTGRIFNTEYAMSADAKNPFSPFIADRKNFYKFEEAKEWVEEALKNQWEKDHPDKEQEIERD